MSHIRFFAALLLTVLIAVGCGPSEREKTLQQDREAILTTARTQVERLQTNLDRAQDENQRLTAQVQTLQIAMQRQQESFDELRFAVKTLGEALSNKEAEITAREAAEKKGGFANFITGVGILFVVGIAIALIYFLFRGKNSDEEDDDFASLDDDIEFDEGVEDDMSKGDSGKGDGADKK